MQSCNPSFLFHGTAERGIKLFEPRQAYNYANGVQEKDGAPAIHATPFLDLAIFMAMFNEINMPKAIDVSYYLDKNNKLQFEVSQKTFDQLNENTKGYVYTFSKSGFEQKKTKDGRLNPLEFVRFEPIKPVKCVEVTAADLPKNSKVRK